MTNLLTQRARQRRIRAERRKAGQCPQCGRDPLPGFRLCATCKAVGNKSDRERMARRRAVWRKLGICLICGDRLAMKPDTRCAVCAEQQDEYKARTRHPEVGAA